MKQDLVNNRGFYIIGVVITLLILAALGIGVANYFAQTQNLKINQVQKIRASYLAKVGIEYAERRIREDAVPREDVVGDYQFGSGTITIEQDAGDVIRSIGRKGNATITNEVVIGSSSGGQGDCMSFHSHGAVWLVTVDVHGQPGVQRTRLRGLKIKRSTDSGCDMPIRIVSLTASWSPDNNYHLTRVQIDNVNSPLEYQDDAEGITSGGTAVFQLPYDVPNPATDQVTYIQWAEVIFSTTFNLSFDLEDGSSFSYTVEF